MHTHIHIRIYTHIQTYTYTHTDTYTYNGYRYHVVKDDVQQMNS